MILAVYTSSPRSKAATTPPRQDFAASAEDVKKPTKAKGSKILNLERECCFRPRGGFWVLIMPGDSSKQKISTTVLGIFVTFHQVKIIFPFFCA